MEEEVYLYNGQPYSQSQLQEKYGDNMEAKIQEHGFERAYMYNDSYFTEAQLEEKYGEDWYNIAQEKGVIPKKKDQAEEGQADDGGDGSLEQLQASAQEPEEQ